MGTVVSQSSDLKTYLHTHTHTYVCFSNLRQNHVGRTTANNSPNGVWYVCFSNLRQNHVGRTTANNSPNGVCCMLYGVWYCTTHTKNLLA